MQERGKVFRRDAVAYSLGFRRDKKLHAERGKGGRVMKLLTVVKVQVIVAPREFVIHPDVRENNHVGLR
jgi:hypothetical protein